MRHSERKSMRIFILDLEIQEDFFQRKVSLGPSFEGWRESLNKGWEYEH